MKLSANRTLFTFVSNQGQEIKVKSNTLLGAKKNLNKRFDANNLLEIFWYNGNTLLFVTKNPDKSYTMSKYNSDNSEKTTYKHLNQIILN